MADNLQHEDLLIRLRAKLNEGRVKLWEPPYIQGNNSEISPSLQELAKTYSSQLSMDYETILGALHELQLHSLDRNKANTEFKQSGLATFRVKATMGQGSNVVSVQKRLNAMGKELAVEVAKELGVPEDRIKLIFNGKVIKQESSLEEQGLKNGVQLMALLMAETPETERLNKEETMYKEMKTTRDDAMLLSEYVDDLADDDDYMTLEDQSGNALQLPPAERRSLLVGLALHERGRAAVKQKDYSLGLVLFLEADRQFNECRSSLLSTVDNWALLQLDIAWCYLCLQALGAASDAGARLQRAEGALKGRGAAGELVDWWWTGDNNWALLQLDIAWCYLCLQALGAASDAGARLQRAEGALKGRGAAGELVDWWWTGDNNWALLQLDIAWCYLCLQALGAASDAGARLQRAEGALKGRGAAGELVDWWWTGDNNWALLQLDIAWCYLCLQALGAASDAGARLQRAEGALKGRGAAGELVDWWWTGDNNWALLQLDIAWCYLCLQALGAASDAGARLQRAEGALKGRGAAGELVDWWWTGDNNWALLQLDIAWCYLCLQALGAASDAGARLQRAEGALKGRGAAGELVDWWWTGDNNWALLQLDIAWCYLCLQALGAASDAGARLQRAEGALKGRGAAGELVDWWWTGDNNWALLQLDIAWCYLCLQALGAASDAGARLQRAEGALKGRGAAGELVDWWWTGDNNWALLQLDIAWCYLCLQALGAASDAGARLQRAEGALKGRGAAGELVDWWWTGDNNWALLQLDIAWCYLCLQALGAASDAGARLQRAEGALKGRGAAGELVDWWWTGDNNWALLQLDIAWCYLCLQALGAASDAGARLQRAEGALKGRGAAANERVVMMRLWLLQGIVAYHQNKRDEARQLLNKAHSELNVLRVDPSLIASLMELGWSRAAAISGLRATSGDVNAAHQHLRARRAERDRARERHRTERQRRALGLCEDGSPVNPKLVEGLQAMGYSKKLAVVALRNSNNHVAEAVRIIQEEAHLLLEDSDLSSEDTSAPSSDDSLVEPDNKLVAELEAMGYIASEAQTALRVAGNNIHDAIDLLVAGGGRVDGEGSVVTSRRHTEAGGANPSTSAGAEKKHKRHKRNKHSCKRVAREEAWQRLSSALGGGGEEDQLSSSLQEEETFLASYRSLL